MSKFKYFGFAEILHLNTRKEGGEDDKELAVDVKFQARTDSFVCSYFDEALEYFFFLPNTGAVRNVFLAPVTFTNELMHYRLEAATMHFTGVKIKKVTFQPRDGKKVDMTFVASLKPSGIDVAKFAEFLQEGIEINLMPENEELDLEVA